MCGPGGYSIVAGAMNEQAAGAVCDASFRSCDPRSLRDRAVIPCRSICQIWYSASVKLPHQPPNAGLTVVAYGAPDFGTVSCSAPRLG
jgi:hypothetical protein